MRNKPKNEIKPFDKGMLVGISFEGPLPHPDILKKYKEIDSLVLKLLLENVKLEGNNRRKSEYKTASRKADMPLFGLIAAFSVCGWNYFYVRFARDYHNFFPQKYF